MSNLLCAIPILSALFSACEPPPKLAVGYVEGEYVYVAPLETAHILEVMVSRGDKTFPNQVLVRMEQRDAEISVAQAEAKLAQVERLLANLRLGKREEEIAVIEASLASGNAQLMQSKREHARQTDLFARGIAPKANYDLAETNLELAEARVAEMSANLTVAKLPARAEEIKAARANVTEAEAGLDAAHWRLKNRILSLPFSTTIIDIIRHNGEVGSPQAPILSVLPLNAIKLRLYVPEPLLATISVGQLLKVHCDGCKSGMQARITYIATDPEFTPPIIYSLENRQKLVYLVEALPEKNATSLKPGQIVDVNLVADPSTP